MYSNRIKRRLQKSHASHLERERESFRPCVSFTRLEHFESFSDKRVCVLHLLTETRMRFQTGASFGSAQSEHLGLSILFLHIVQILSGLTECKTFYDNRDRNL